MIRLKRRPRKAELQHAAVVVVKCGSTIAPLYSSRSMLMAHIGGRLVHMETASSLCCQVKLMFMHAPILTTVPFIIGDRVRMPVVQASTSTSRWLNSCPSSLSPAVTRLFRSSVCGLELLRIRETGTIVSQLRFTRD